MRIALQLSGGNNDPTSSFTSSVKKYAHLIAEFGDCLSFDYFKPVKTELLMEKMALSERGFRPIASKMNLMSVIILSLSECRREHILMKYLTVDTTIGLSF